MMISYLSHKKIEISSAGLYEIATVSPIVFKDFVLGMQENSDLIKIYDESNQELSLSKDIDYVGDVLLGHNVLTKYAVKITNKIVAGLDEDSRNAILTAFHKLYATVQDELLLEDVPLKIDFDEDLKHLFKFLGIAIEPEYIDNPYGIIETILKIHQFCHLTSDIVVYNLCNYLDEDQMNELSKLAKQMNEKVILIEFSDKQKTKNSEFYYIDNDLIDWY